MRISSFSPIQSPVTGASTNQLTTLLQNDAERTTSPASALTLTGLRHWNKQNTSIERFLSTRRMHFEHYPVPMVESECAEHAVVTLEGEVPERPKRRLPAGHAKRFTTSTTASASSDDVVIEPVNRWSDVVGPGGRPQIAPNVLLFRVRGASRNAPSVKNGVITQPDRGRLNVTRTTDLSRNDSIDLSGNPAGNASFSAAPITPAGGGIGDRDVPFSPDLSEDVYLGKKPSKSCDRPDVWNWQSFRRCQRGGVSGPLPMGERAELSDLTSAPSLRVLPTENGSFLLPATSPLWLLLTGKRPRWLFPDGTGKPISNMAVADVADVADVARRSTSPDTGVTTTPERVFGPEREPLTKYKT